MKFKTNYRFCQERYLLMALALTWIIIQTFLLWYNGIVTGLEAGKYITQAEHFLQAGKFTSDNYWLYSTQIFLLAAAMKLHLPFTVIVAVQLSLNLLATWIFYQLAATFLKKRILAFIVTFIFIINVTYQLYNSFLFTESVFYSLTTIYSSYLLRIKKAGVKNGMLLLIMLAVLCVTRPTGILFFGATAVYIFSRYLKNMPAGYQLVITGSMLAIFLITLNQMLQAGGSLDFMLPFKQENIICGVNTFHNTGIDITEQGNSLQGLFYYVIHNKEQFLSLSWLKTISFFGYTRDYYSPLHNAYLMIFFYPFYILSIVGIIKTLKRKEKTGVYLLTIILLYWITTVLTCDDWHNRFILTVSPFIFLLGFAAFTKAESIPEEK